MSIKKFTEYSLKENKMDDKIEDMKQSHEEVSSKDNEISINTDL